MPKKPKPSRLNIPTDQSKEGDSLEKVMAPVALSPLAGNVHTAKLFSKGTFGAIDLLESIKVIRDTADHAIDGGTDAAVEMLVGQATALNSIFNELARRAALNMGEHLKAAESYMRLALQAQRQCRATLETLVEIKNPRSLAFVKQANIAHGPQQVNNGVSANSPPSHAREEKTIQSNELLTDGVEHGPTLDNRGAPTPSGADKELASVGAIDRAKDAGR